MRLFQSKLNSILDKRHKVQREQEAKRQATAFRPLPRYPDALRSLKVHSA